MQYEINGTIHGELYTLTDKLKIDKTDSVRYNKIDINKLKQIASDSEYDTITIYNWKGEGTNVEIEDSILIK